MIGDSDLPHGMDQRFEQVINRLVTMVNDRYGCELVYRDLQSIKEKEKASFCGIGSQSPIRVIQNRSIFPISVKGDLVGIGEVRDRERISDRSIHAIRDFLSIFIESLHLSQDSRLLLHALEKQFQMSSKSTSNVISLQNFKLEQGIGSPHVFDIAFDGNSSINIPFLIEAPTKEDAFKMALEVHGRSRRFAFLDFSQMDLRARTRLDELQKLGNISLFINELSLLKDEEIFCLTTYLKQKPSPQRPQIIAASSQKIKCLLEKQIVPRELIELLNVAFLRMTDSFYIYRKKGLIEYFFRELVHTNK